MGQDRIDIAALDSPEPLLAPEAAVSVGSPVCFQNGPAEDDRGCLLFNGTSGGHILRRASDGPVFVSVFRQPSGRFSGKTFDAQGRLVNREGTGQGLDGGRRIVRANPATGAIAILFDHVDGRRSNCPSGVVVGPMGRVRVAAPDYGPSRELPEHRNEAVNRIDPDGSVSRVPTQPGIERPSREGRADEVPPVFDGDSGTRGGSLRESGASGLGAGENR